MMKKMINLSSRICKTKDQNQIKNCHQKKKIMMNLSKQNLKNKEIIKIKKNTNLQIQIKN